MMVGWRDKRAGDAVLKKIQEVPRKPMFVWKNLIKAALMWTRKALCEDVQICRQACDGNRGVIDYPPLTQRREKLQLSKRDLVSWFIRNSKGKKSCERNKKILNRRPLERGRGGFCQSNSRNSLCRAETLLHLQQIDAFNAKSFF